MLTLATTVNCFPPALNRQLAFLAGRAFEQGPHLPQSGVRSRNAIDRNQMIARLHSVIARRYRRLAIEIRDAENRKARVVFGTQDQSDDIEVRKLESLPISK